MSADNSRVFDNPDILTSYQQTNSLTWCGSPSPYRLPIVSWKINYPILGVAGDIVGCPETEVLKYHGLENLAQDYGLDVKRKWVANPEVRKAHDKVHNRKILRYFMNLSQKINKRIELHCQRPLFDGDGRYSFELLVDPEMTWPKRIAKMRRHAVTAGEILAEDSNVGQVFFGGSAQRGVKYPGDVDLLVTTQEQLVPNTNDSLSVIGPLCALPFINCKGREGNPFKYLHRETLYQLDKISNEAGFRLDCILVSQLTSDNPICCDNHARLIREFKVGLKLK